jgi:hypothetical protein
LGEIRRRRSVRRAPRRVAFAAAGDCRRPKGDPTRKPMMHFEPTSEIVDDPLAVELVLWKGVR